MEPLEVCAVGLFRKSRKKVRIQELILEDANGRERGGLTVDGDDNALIYFKDGAGKVRLFVGLTTDGTPRMSLQYAKGKGSIQFEANDSLNSAAMIISGPSGRAQVIVGIAANGIPAMALFDGDGNRLYPQTDSQASGEPNNPPGDTSGGFDWDNLLKRT